ncbi:MAG: [citrate (pro-3S)-lyase] ligase [Ruminococcaceae bacterium]|nr:[citrate (pro-3S)-lyase] ligase [Oscillospiraceae bacterium]
MDEFSQIELREINLSFKWEVRRMDDLLRRCGIRRDPLEYAVGLYDGEELACCGGFDGSTVKCVAVDPAHRGEALMNTLISHLQEKLVYRGVKNIKVFTKPENEAIFTSVGFHVVDKVDQVLLLESGHPGIRDYTAALEKERREGINGAIVMNCNPFTKGHRYLIEYAASRCDWLNVFVVREDKSLFPFDVRYDLVKRGTADLPNVIVRDGGDYMISSSTFPSYFLKEYSSATRVHANLDVDIFGKFIAPALGISVRFAGEEPFDPVTLEYNKAMIEILPKYGLEKPQIIERLHSGHEVISAGRVRRHLAKGEMDRVRECVPDLTYEFLLTERGAQIIQRIKETVSV